MSTAVERESKTVGPKGLFWLHNLGLAPRKLLFWIFLALVALVILYPLAWLLFGSELTLSKIGQFAVDPRVLELLTRTLGVALLATFLSGAIGTALAFLVRRTDIPAKNLVSVLVLASYMTPSFILAFAYVMILAPNTGLINRFIEAVFGVKQALNIFTPAGFILLATFEATPIVYLIMSHIFASMNRSLEDSARLLGAPAWQVIATITLPLALPGTAAASLLVFVNVISLYGVPAILGVPVITTEIQALFSWPPKYDEAAFYALTLILLSCLAVYLYRVMVRGQDRFATVSGRWEPPRRFRLGKWRVPIFVVTLLYATMSVLLPYTMLIAASISENWTVGMQIDNLTLANYEHLFRDQYNVRAIRNSVMLAIGAATGGVIIGFLISYIELRAEELRGKRLLDYLAMLPWGIPSIALGAALILAFTRPPVLYGTKWILFYAYLVKFMPLAVRATSSALKQVKQELEEASRITGATDWRAVLDVTLPLIRGGLVAGWLLMFFPSLRELSSSVLLVSPGNETLAVAALTAWESVNFEVATALSVVTLAVSVIPWILLSRAGRGSFIEIG